MPEHEPLSRKPSRTTGYFWTVWADWDLVVKVGFAFVALIATFAVIRFHFEDGNQQQSFAVARAAITAPLGRPLTQHQARLLKQGASYDWRAIVWVRSGADLTPRIWRAIVLHEGKTFRCDHSELSAYDAGKARSLELYESITSPPAITP